MRHTRLFAVLTVLLTTATFAAPVAARSLQGRLDSIVQATNLGDAKVTFHVMDLSDGLAVAERDADTPMIPASNMKLITSAAAAVLFDNEFHFTTRLYRQGDSLIIVGDGDPAFGDPKILAAMNMNIEDLLQRWVGTVEKAGVKKVDRVIVDDRIFDQQRVHPNWPTNQLNRWYCAEVAGLNFNNNCLDVYATPTQPGQSPMVHTRPLNASVVMTNAARSGSKDAVWATRDVGTNRITVRGEVRHRLIQPIYVTVDDPSMFFGRTYRDRLVEAGIEVAEVVRATDDLDMQGAMLLAEVRTPLREVLARCNKDSQNLFAEALLKRIGHEATGNPGSWSSGAAAVRGFLSKTLGPDAARIVIDDGSGMSRENRVSAELLCRLMFRMHRMGDVGVTYRESLAIGGEEGTLRKRFGAHDIHATVYGKSGYINGVLALSGYVMHEDRAYAFSILVNDYKRELHIGRSMMDRMVMEMDRELTDRVIAD